MSDKKENENKTNNGKANKKKSISETNKGNSKSDEQQMKKVISWNDDSDSGKNSRIKNEIKQLIDNFGERNSDHDSKSQSNPTANTFILEEQHLFNINNSEQSVDQMPSAVDLLRENNKDSTDDTTLEGKFIEIQNEECHCLTGKCNCGSTDYCNCGQMHNYTDVDDSQMISDINEILPHDSCPHHPPQHITPCNIHENCNHSKVDKRNSVSRYNYNQVQLQNKKKGRTIFGNIFPRRGSIKKHYISKEDSGETVPQLFKANVKHCGYIPERFTFKAVTGNVPGKLEYCPNNARCMCPRCQSVTNHVNFMPTEREGKDRKTKNEKKPNIIRNLKKKKRNNLYFDKNKKFPYKSDVKNNQNDLYQEYRTLDKACLRFEGNEYVSTKELPDRIDIYCFDHLNTSYFRTCDQPPPLITDIAMEKTEEVATRFWAEIFGFIHVILAFFIAFILQFYKFLLYSIVRPILVGLVQLTSDYFFKPLLTITYNGFTQPLLVFLFNVAASIRDLCSQIAKALGYFVAEVAVILRAIRLVDCSKYNGPRRQMKDSSC